MNTCCVCGQEKRLYNTFGKLKCKECIDKTKTGKPGHSGMIYDKDANPGQFTTLFYNKDIELIPVKKSHKLFVKWYIEHYPGSKGIVGRQLNYLIYYKGVPVGIISLASPPLNYKLFRKYFDSTDDLCFLNNNVYRIVNKPDDKNFGTKVLKEIRTICQKDYFEKYNSILKGLITFVEPPRTGSIYKADNWEYLGQTQGIEVRRKGEDWFQKTYSVGTKKHIYAIKIKPTN